MSVTAFNRKRRADADSKVKAKADAKNTVKKEVVAESKGEK